MVIFGCDVDDVVVVVAVVAVVDSDAKPTSTDKLAVTTSEAIKLILSLNLMSYKFAQPEPWDCLKMGSSNFPCCQSLVYYSIQFILLTEYFWKKLVTV